MYELPIERGKIREFALATKSKNPSYDSADAVIPPTFLTIAGMAWEPPGESSMAQIGFDLKRLLHGEEEYIFHGPLPRAGQTLTVTHHISDRYEKESSKGGVMKFATVVHEFRDADGNLVAEQRTTAVETPAR